MILLKIYIFFFILDALIIAVHICQGKRRRRRRVRQMIEEIFNRKTLQQ